MSDQDFEAAVLEIRVRCERLRNASTDQLIGLGAELQAQQAEIIEVFAQRGLMYGIAPWV